jgi:hypothetical protein
MNSPDITTPEFYFVLLAIGMLVIPPLVVLSFIIWGI